MRFMAMQTWPVLPKDPQNSSLNAIASATRYYEFGHWGNIRSNGHWIHIFTDDDGIVTSKLKRNTFESRRNTSHNRLAGSHRACEWYFCDARMFWDPGPAWFIFFKNHTKVFVVTNSLTAHRFRTKMRGHQVVEFAVPIHRISMRRVGQKALVWQLNSSQ